MQLLSQNLQLTPHYFISIKATMIWQVSQEWTQGSKSYKNSWITPIKLFSGIKNHVEFGNGGTYL